MYPAGLGLIVFGSYSSTKPDKTMQVHALQKETYLYAVAKMLNINHLALPR